MAQRTDLQIQQDIQDKINQLVGNEKRLRQDALDLLIQQGRSAAEFLQLERDIERQLKDINRALDYTKSTFDDLIEKVKEKNKALQFQETLLSKTNRIVQDLLEIRKGETFADSEKINKLKQQNLLQIDYLTHLKKSNQLTDDQRKEIDREIKELKLVDKEFEKINNRNKEINKGLLGSIPAIAKMASGLGISNTAITDAYQNTIKMGQGFMASGAKINAMKTFAKELGTSVSSSLGPLALLVKFAELLVEAFKASDKNTGQLAKDFNITYKEASNLRSELNEIAGLTGDNAVNTERLQESMVAVGKALGTNAMLNKGDLVTFTKLREQAGYTNEELIGIQRITLATGGTLKSNLKSFLGTVTALNGQNKLAINAKQLLKEVANVSDAIKLSVGGTATKLAEAAFKAKQFGITLEQADRISSGLLDFEKSINAELSAQLITGKDLNLENARFLALNGQVADAAADILKQVGGTAEFTRMNRIQQEALAEAVGLSRDDLAKSLVDREALVKMGGQEGKAQDQYNKLRAQGLSQTEIAARLGDEALAQQFEQQSIQERFNDTALKLKDIFTGIAQSLMPVLDILASAFKIVGYMVAPFAAIMDIAGSIYGPLKGIVGLLSAATVAALILNGSLTFGLGTIAVLTAAGAGIAYMNSQQSEATQFAEGGIITKPITNATVGEAGPEAIIPLNSPTSEKYLGKAKGENQFNDSNMISELREIKNILQKTYNLDVAQGLSNPLQAVGTAAAGTYNYYKTQ